MLRLASWRLALIGRPGFCTVVQDHGQSEPWGQIATYGFLQTKDPSIIIRVSGSSPASGRRL